MKRLIFSIVALLFVALMPLYVPETAASAFRVNGTLPPNPGLNQVRNEDGEPGIAADGGGTFWVGSNDLFNDSRSAEVLSGEDIWKSTNGGKSYQWVASPFGATSTTPGLAGEDSDIAAAPVKNANGYYNVYATSLWVGSTSVAISQDGGNTWILDPLGGLPAEDRPWIAADGPCSFYVTYHQLPTWDPVVNHYDICDPTQTAIGAAITPVSSTPLFLSNSVPGLTNVFGKTWVDTSATSPFQHTIYVPMMGCDLNGPTEIVQNEESSSGCLNKTEVFVGVSRDGGQTFNNYKVAEGTNGEEPIWCCTVSTDAAGTAYFAWTDNHNSYLSVSRNAGQTWSAPVRLNRAGTAVYPTVAGGKAGVVSVAYYGTTATGDANDEKVMKDPGATGAAKWVVQVATSTNSGKTFGISTVTPTVHTGVLCTGGDNCSVANSRDLYDDFGAVYNRAGTLSIAYTSDQPRSIQADVFTGYATIAQ